MKSDKTCNLIVIGVGINVILKLFKGKADIYSYKKGNQIWIVSKIKSGIRYK